MIRSSRLEVDPMDARCTTIGFAMVSALGACALETDAVSYTRVDQDALDASGGTFVLDLSIGSAAYVVDLETIDTSSLAIVCPNGMSMPLETWVAVQPDPVAALFDRTSPESVVVAADEECGQIALETSSDRSDCTSICSRCPDGAVVCRLDCGR
jgi:hypothetical protein